ncbi:GGDEF domain-containing protein [Streptomyces sp. NPDC017941]|uniref:GGDEF domain-containing protein n=1 Tax=unclassified Streptomyces TaxID=2593676 RepID=UPI0037B00E85
MTSTVRVQAPAGTRTLILTTLAVPLTGWTVHAVQLHRQLAGGRRQLAAAQRQLAAARHDPLTKLLTRDGYTALAEQLLTRHRRDVLVLMLDVDEFKQINDSYGHPVGDRVLEVTARRLTAWAGPGAAVGILGGDEFAAAVRIAPSRRRERLVDLVAALAQPVTVDGGLVDVAVSVGAAAPDTIGADDLPTLHRAADAAMYAGKHSGRAVLATPDHARTPSVHGRRAGRPGAGRRAA